MTADTSHHSHDDADAAPDGERASPAEHGHDEPDGPGGAGHTVMVQLPEPMAVRLDHAAFGSSAACEAVHVVDGYWCVEVDLYGAPRVELTVSEARELAAELLAAARWAEQREGIDPFAEGGTDGAGDA